MDISMLSEDLKGEYKILGDLKDRYKDMRVVAMEFVNSWGYKVSAEFEDDVNKFIVIRKDKK